MASKNICSLGYIHFPLLSFPDSTSLFAGLPSFPSSVSAVALGIVDISRAWSRPSFERMAEGGGGELDKDVESQDSPAGIDRGGAVVVGVGVSG